MQNEPEETWEICSEKIEVTIDGVRYEWFGGLGAVLKSRERGVKSGDLRIIGGIVFKATWIDPLWFCSEICWVPFRSFDVEWMRRFKTALFL